MITFKGVMTTLLLLMATSAFGAIDGATWPGSSITAAVGVVIVLFVVARWKSKP